MATGFRPTRPTRRELVDWLAHNGSVLSDRGHAGQPCKSPPGMARRAGTVEGRDQARDAAGNGHARQQRRRRARADPRQPDQPGRSRCRDDFWKRSPARISRRSSTAAAGWSWLSGCLTAANPFITRVIVNRLWKHLFGRGIVPSVDNFGVLGQAPSTSRIARLSGRSFCRRRLVAEAHDQAHGHVAQLPDVQPAGRRSGRTLDPKNLLLHRMPLRRLEAESIRDCDAGRSAGPLRSEIGGPSVPVHLTAFMEGRGPARERTARW